MDWIWIISGVVLTFAGLIGCIVPLIPGPPLSYLALVLLLLTDRALFSSDFMALWLIITFLVTVLDYYVPVWGAKKFGGTTKGIWGATLGLIAGIFLIPPFGIIVGPFIGAYLGEIIGGNQHENALKAGFGTFIGFLAGTVMKLAVSSTLTFYFFKALLF